jgi:DNA-binding transcriptional ArsR family regulator/uncharacterized damage-inducible protein DinB
MKNQDQGLDLLLRALADHTRRTMLDRLRDAPGLTLGELIAGLPQSRQALSKHLAVLEDAELVVPVWRGREKRHFLNPAPLQALPGRWVTASPQEDAAALGHLRDALAPLPDASHGPQAGPAGLAALAAAAPAVAGGRRPALDTISELLLVAPSARLQGQPVLQMEALADARDYLAGTAQAVQALLAALPADGGYQRPAAGGFSLVEHLAHLADIETLGWCSRFERILAEPRPRLPGVDGDRLALEQRYQARPWRGAARRFVAQRKRSLALLQRFDAEVLRRPVFFAGARTRAGGVVAAAVAHDLDHRPAMALAWQQMVERSSP